MSITAQPNGNSALPPGVLAKRMLTGALCFAGIIAGIICIDVRAARALPGHQLYYGHDLLPSYVAGTFVRKGHPRDMYDIDAVHREEATIVRSADLSLDHQGGPWLNPPFFAWLFVPLSRFSYRQASAVFLAANLSLLIASSLLLIRQLPVRDWRIALVPAILCTSMPFWQALCHQQNSFISLFLLTLTVTFWERNRPFMAGCFAGLLFFKPQLAVVVSFVLIATAGRRAFAGIALTGAFLLGVTLLTLPGTLFDFLTKLSPIVRILQADPAYNWGRQDTFQSFWRLLIEGHIAGPTPLVPKLLTWASSGIVALLLIYQTHSFIWEQNAVLKGKRLRRLIAATIVSMPLLMPYYMDYDLLLLAVPAVLFAGDWLESGRHVGWARPTILTLEKVGTAHLFDGEDGGQCPPYECNPTRTTPSANLSSSPRARGADRNAARWQLALWITLFLATQISPGLAGQTRFNIAVPLLAVLCGITLASCRADRVSSSGNSSQPDAPGDGLLAA
jgi:hypothetical protein